MVMVLPMNPSLGPNPRECSDVRGAPGKKFSENGEDGVGGRRAAGNINVHRNDFVDGTRVFQQLGQTFRGILLLGRGSFLVGAVKESSKGEGVAHRGNVAGDGAIAKGDERTRALAEEEDFVFVFVGADRTFDESDIDFFGEVLLIDDGGTDD